MSDLTGTGITRRDVLKLLSVLPLLTVDLPTLQAGRLPAAQDENLPNFLILVFDALSAFHLPFYGYARQTAPNLTRFAEKATVFHQHHAGGNFTTPGTSSLLTGALPWSTRAFHLQGTVIEPYVKRNIFSELGKKGYYRTAYSHNNLVTSLFFQFHQDIDEFIPTRELCLLDDEFADQLFPNDYTPAFLGEWLTFRGGETRPSSLFLSFVHRLYRSLHKRMKTRDYRDQFPRGIPELHNLSFVLEDATDWIINQVQKMPRPFLAYYHLLPPHEPYLTRKDFVDIFHDGWKPVEKPEHPFTEGHTNQFLLRNRREYDEYIAYADAEFGRLYDALEKNGSLENTYLIVTSDHGEMFERGVRGHVTPVLYEPVIRVPLLIKKPGQQAREDVHIPTSCVDVLPTLLHLAGLEIPDWTEGQVLPTFGAGEPDSERSIFALEAKKNQKHAPLTKRTVMMVKDRYKIMHFTGYEKYNDVFEMYDLQNDPEELNNIFNSHPALASEMKSEMFERLVQADNNFLGA